MLAPLGVHATHAGLVLTLIRGTPQRQVHGREAVAIRHAAEADGEGIILLIKSGIRGFEFVLRDSSA